MRRSSRWILEVSRRCGEDFDFSYDYDGRGQRANLICAYRTHASRLNLNDCQHNILRNRAIEYSRIRVPTSNRRSARPVERYLGANPYPEVSPSQMRSLCEAASSLSVDVALDFFIHTTTFLIELSNLPRLAVCTAAVRTL